MLNANSIDLSEDDVEAFVQHFTDGILPALRTPRQVKRYVNAIRFAVPLLKGEVHVGDAHGDLVKSLLESKTRLAVAREVVTTATPLSFAAECLRGLTYQSKNKTDTTALTEEEEAEAGAIVASRIAEALSGTPNYAKYGRRLGGLLGIWKKFGSKGDMETFLAERFSNYPEEAARFLDAFIGRAYGLESGLSHKASFDRNDFDNVAWLINPTWILAALKKQFGSLVDDATFDNCWELSGDQQTACRFAAIYRKVQEENAKKTPIAEESTSVDADSAKDIDGENG